ncbi:MAG: DNA repair protein RecN [Rhodospirillales bacterium]|nr:DNA repair protein RecN [Rhodospirillales bacterium]
MLRTLSIRNVVLIDRLDLAFEGGLGVLTGETGAGKSILLDALGLALGERAEAKLVRHGAEQATVTAAFDLPPGHPVFGLLAEQGVEAEDGELLLRRALGTDGRSRAFLNDQPVSVSLLRQVGGLLVEIHGQFESQRLLNAGFHRPLLDAQGGLQGKLDSVAAAYRHWREAAEAHARAEADLEAARRDEEFLRHAADELSGLDPQPGEEQELADQRALLMNSEQVVEDLNAATAALDRGDGVEDAVAAAIRHLERIAAKLAGRFDAALAALARGASELAEGRALLDRAGAEMDLDPAHLEEVEERLFALRALARKHGVEVDGLPDLLQDFRRKLDSVEDGAAHLEKLAAAEAAARDVYCRAAESLSKARTKAAKSLAKTVGDELAPLKLEKALFTVLVESQQENEDAWGAEGWDRVAFEVSTNPGQPPGPLNKIASGGELARFMLALKVALAEADPVPTLIFDEVDSGIGGAVAAAVGVRLALLAESYQVLVVTHSPQVAAQGAHHMRVSKSDAAKEVLTTVHTLNSGDRQEEIARMLAGASITDEARAAATKLLEGDAA